MAMAEPEVEREVERALAEVAGEEARDLRRLLAARVAVARGHLVPLESRPEGLVALVSELLDAGAERVLVRVLAPSSAERRSLEQAGPGELRAGDDVVAFTKAWTELRGRDVFLRVVPASSDGRGGAASVDPQRGDPDTLAVWAQPTPDGAWRIDRRSTRVEVPGEGLGVILAERVADLVDRVQLEVGAPVRVEWVLQDGRPRVLGVRPLVVEPTFVAGRWRRVALVAADEGTVAPLAVDTLDRALRDDDGPPGELAVRRLYARPYRRREPALAPLGEGVRADLSRASAESASAGAKVVRYLADAFRFERAAADCIEAFDAELSCELTDEALLTSLRERQRHVADGLRMLDRGRVATREVLAALEAVVGPMRREQHAALATLRMVRARRRFHDRLRALAKSVEDAHGALVPIEQWSPPLRRRFEELRAGLGDLRPLGVDVAPVPYGRDDETLHRAMQTRPRPGPAARERAREEVLEGLTHSAGGGGPLRVALVRALGVLALRVARAKGGAAESVSAGLLRVRRSACEIGLRLVRRAVLDDAEDALYLSSSELEDALRGEPGAYAARVRLRREDDLRWRNFAAPRRVGRA